MDEAVAGCKVDVDQAGYKAAVDEAKEIEAINKDIGEVAIVEAEGVKAIADEAS